MNELLESQIWMASAIELHQKEQDAMTKDVAKPRAGSPMRTFWVTVGLSALVLFMVALFFGRYGVESPLRSSDTNPSDVWSINVAIWSLAITSVVSIAGSITAIAIANAANQSQRDSERLRAIDVYHSDPAYQKALRVSGAYLSARSTLQLILTGLGESRTQAISHGTANPLPMILRWRVFSRDLHKSLVESDLYDYLLESNQQQEMIAWSVGILLTTAEELDAIALAPEPSGHSPGEGGDSTMQRKLFERNTLAYLAAGQLFDCMRNAPELESLYRTFGGQEAPPYVRNGKRDIGSMMASSSVAIRSLAREFIQRFQASSGIPVFLPLDAAGMIADSLRAHFQELAEDNAPLEFTPIVLVDFALPFATKTLKGALEQSLHANSKGEGCPTIPGIAKRVLEIHGIEDSLEHIGESTSVNDLAMTIGTVTRSMASLLPAGRPTIDIGKKALLDRLGQMLDARNPETLFVFHLHNELDQAEMCFLASILPRSVVVWHGWPLIPNEQVAFKTLFEQGRFSRAGISSESFPFRVPVIFMGGLSFSLDEGAWASNLATEKLRGICRFMAVSDLGSLRWSTT